MRAADIMTRQVVTTGADAPIATAVRLMLQNRISSLPVVDPLVPSSGGVVARCRGALVIAGAA